MDIASLHAILVGHVPYTNVKFALISYLPPWCRSLIIQLVPVEEVLDASAAAANDTGDTNDAVPTRPIHIPTNEEEEQHVDAVHGSHSWEARILHVLHSPPVELALAGLLLLDVIILFVELFIGAQFPSCSVIERDAISCCPNYPDDADMYAAAGDSGHRYLVEGKTDDTRNCGIVGHDDYGGGGHFLLRYLAAAAKEDGGHHSVCAAGVEATCPAGCDEHRHAAVHTLHTVLFSLTIAILGVFLIELSLLILCLKPRVFFRKPFYVLDFVVVTMSLGLELGFYLSSNETVAELAGLLIFARLWRFVRIGHGIIEVTNEYHGHKHGKVMKYNRQLEELLVKNGIAVPENVRREMKKLKRLDSVATEADADGAAGVDETNQS